MSYILNALRKSEQDRQAKQSSNQEFNISTPQPKQKPLILWLVIGILVINILVLVYFLFLKPEQDIALSGSENKTAVIEPATLPEIQQPAIKTEQPEPQLVTPKKALPTPSFSQESVKQSSISDMLEQQSVQKKPIDEPADKVASVSKKLNPGLPKETAHKAEENKPLRTTKVQSKPNPDNDIPYLYEMSPQFRRNVPDFNINVFVYSNSPDDRFVIMDMKKYTEGQETENGLEIKAIKNDSLVLRYQNKSFQIKRP